METTIETTNNDVAEPENKSKSFFGTIKRIYQNITVEPLIICWLLPFLVTFAAIENMNLEKGCRALVTPETGFDKDVCKLFVRKAEYNIECVYKNGTEFIENLEAIKTDEIMSRYPEIFESIKDKLSNVTRFLCDAEDAVQNKLLTINSIRNPLSSIGPLIIILFAGPWSDKKKLRVPCMLVPYLGEAFGYLAVFISAIFINGPVEFPAYAYRLIPSFTGAENLMVMGIFSYLTAVSSEENRTLRFGMFQILLTVIPIFAQSIGAFLVKQYDYKVLFGSMIPIHIIGFLYAIFFLKEPSKLESKEEAAYDNEGMAVEMSTNETNGNHNSNQIIMPPTEKKNACLEFFNPDHVVYCILSFVKKRENNLRQIIVLFMLMHFMGHGITQGETQNLLLYVRAKLNWDVDTFVLHTVYTIIMGLFGTTFAIGLLSKLFQVADIILILLSTILSICCRIVYLFAFKTITFFVASGIDFMYSIKFLAARSIISKIVPNEDLSTMFAIMGLFEAFAGFIFPYVYPVLYGYLRKSKTLDIAIIYALSILLLILSLIVYTFLWKLLPKKEPAEQENENGLESTKL